MTESPASYRTILDSARAGTVFAVGWNPTQYGGGVVAPINVEPRRLEVAR